jgi:hypothetical protein
VGEKKVQEGRNSGPPQAQMKHLLVVEYDPEDEESKYGVKSIQEVCEDYDVSQHIVIIAPDAPDVAWGVAFKAALGLPTSLPERGMDG